MHQMTILDIGAFEGMYALAARKANKYASIYAFEPNPNNVAALRKNVIGQNIHIEETAVSDNEGEVVFSLESATSHISQSDSSNYLQAGITVRSISLDAWTQINHTLPDLIKIDTEGHESAILRGAKNMFKNRSPIILCEVLSDDAGKDVMQSIPNGYIFYHIDENKGVTHRAVIDRKKWRNRNWLLAPISSQALLKRLFDI